MSAPSVQVEAQQRRWEARPVLAALLRAAVLLVPLLVAVAATLAVGRLLGGAATTWWGLLLLLAVAVAVSAVVERGARRLLPVTVLLRLSTVFPDRAPSRLRLARDAAVRSPRDQLLWSDASARPVSTSGLVTHLVAVLGSHDRRTRGHSERVQVLCDVLARELGLSAEDRDRLRWSALLHDIGKVRIAAGVLNKPARLDAREFAAVREHPEVGAAIAAPLLPWLGQWGEAVLDHHERWDGAGYPNGKAGEDISPAGRLVAVVDAYETMTASRPYKRAVAARTAREELARCAGTHFDPAMVRAFLGVSLPRLLWATGPLAFVLQLPGLRPLAHTGARAGAALPQVGPALVGGAAGAAGAAALGLGALGGGTAGSGAGALDAVAAPAPVTSSPAPQRSEPVVTAPPVAPPAAPAAPPVAPTDGSGSPDAGPPPAAAAPVVADDPLSPAQPVARPVAAESGDPAVHPAIASGPPSPTTDRTAVFELREAPGAGWECQLLGNADGGGSDWRPCAGTFEVTVLGPGDHVLRVRDVDTRGEVDAWSWTVVDGPSPAPPPGTPTAAAPVGTTAVGRTGSSPA